MGGLLCLALPGLPAAGGLDAAAGCGCAGRLREQALSGVAARCRSRVMSGLLCVSAGAFRHRDAQAMPRQSRQCAGNAQATRRAETPAETRPSLRLMGTTSGAMPLVLMTPARWRRDAAQHAPAARRDGRILFSAALLSSNY